MSTLLFITDTHAGTAGTGFCQQPVHAHLLPQILAGVRRLIHEHQVDLLIHGGDMTETGDSSLAADLFAGIDIPIAACLGNHDLMAPASHEHWRDLSLPRLIKADVVIHLDDVDLVLLNNHWLHDGRPGMFWNGAMPQEVLVESQLAWLDETLAVDPSRPACLVVHAPPDPIPARLTGRSDNIHKPYAPYPPALNALLDRHPRVKLVLSGHNHATTATRYPGRLHLTTSSLIETPFELRLIRFMPHEINVQTLAAIPRPSDARYDTAKSWVNGAAQDRNAAFVW